MAGAPESNMQFHRNDSCDVSDELDLKRTLLATAHRGNRSHNVSRGLALFLNNIFEE